MRKNVTGKTIVWVLMILLILSVFSSCENKKDISDASSDIVTSQTTANDDSSIDEEENTSAEADASVLDDSSDESVSDTPVESIPTQAQTSTPVPSVSKPTASTSTPTTTTPTPSTPEKEPEQEKPKTAKELIIGKWKGKYDFAPSLQAEGYSVEGPCNVDYIIEFTSSGSTVHTVNMATLLQVMRPVLEEEMKAEIANNGMTVEQFEAEVGMTFTEYVDAVLLMYSEDMNMVGSYKFDGDVLSMKDEGETEYTVSEYKFDGENTVSITDDGETIIFTRMQ